MPCSYGMVKLTATLWASAAATSAAAQRRRERGLPEAARRARTVGRSLLAARLGIGEDQAVAGDVDREVCGDA